MRSSVDVHNYLVERDIQHELFRVRGRLRTPERLAAVLDLPAEQVGRVVVYESNGALIAVLVGLDKSPDPKRVKRAAKASDIAEASSSRASELADYIPDAIPPVALPPGFTVVMDRELASQDIVYFQAGDATAVLKLRGADLARAADAKLAKLA